MVQTTDSQIPEEVLLPNRGAYDPDVEAEEALREAENYVFRCGA